MPKLAKLNPKVCDLALALEEFLLARQADVLVQRTLDDYRWHVGKFLETCQNTTTYEAVRKATIRYFSQPASPGYRNIKLKYLKAFFNWCVAQGYLPANPAQGIRKAKEDLQSPPMPKSKLPHRNPPHSFKHRILRSLDFLGFETNWPFGFTTDC
ncbi:MAG: integrase/recombinase XerD [Moorella sp. (in: firmicutes)]|jgi:site-specific recombinase XerC|nr:integrase/recombinase XerD [Moorella sp. (in: firmicutes)]